MGDGMGSLGGLDGEVLKSLYDEIEYAIFEEHCTKNNSEYI